MTLLERILDRSPRVACTACSLQFTPVLEDVPTDAGGAVRQFACPHCNFVTRVAIFSPYGVKLLEQVQEALGRRDHRLVNRLQKKLQKEVRRP